VVRIVHPRLPCLPACLLQVLLDQEEGGLHLDLLQQQLEGGGQQQPASRAWQHPRHAALPGWHFDMVADAGRNAAYARAIGAAMERARARLAPGEPLAALDLGSGSGLLAMMAARCAAGWLAGWSRPPSSCRCCCCWCLECAFHCATHAAPAAACSLRA
jgi:hypothetical protein